MGRELLRRPADDVDAEIAERLLDLWIIERGRERAIERGDHVLRRVRGRHQAVPGGGVEILDPELVDGRNIGQDRGALEGRDRELRTFPSRIWGTTDEAVANIICTWPAITSCNAGAAPL